MKKLLLFLIVLLANTTIKSFSQTVNGINLKDLNLEYIQIHAKKKLLSSNFNFMIDVGNPSQLNGNDNSVKDSSGKEIVFDNLVDALNYLDKLGYDFVQTYSMPGDDNNIYYLMKNRDESYYKDN